MDDARLNDEMLQTKLGAPCVVGLASRVVVSVLATLGSDSGPRPIETLLADFVTAAASTDDRAFGAVVGAMQRAHIPGATIADLYIPEAARRLGADWVSDRLSFADVTIGLSRLQALLRTVSGEAPADRAGTGSNRIVLIWVPDGEDHTLGALVATGWLRRRGISVALNLNESVKKVADLVSRRDFDAVLISAGNEHALDRLAQMIGILRKACKRPIPVFVGGSVMGSRQDIRLLTGADFATNDLELVARNIGAAAPVVRVMAEA